MKKAVAVALATMMCASQAFAWMALAGNGSYTFVSSNFDTEAEARQVALKGCSAAADGCELELVGNGTAMLIAKGAGGYAWATRPDPREAAKVAMANCTKAYKGCRLAQAVWDKGVTWGGVAVAEDYLYVSTNKSSREEMERTALAGCRAKAGKPETCRLHEPSVNNVRASYAFAASPKSSAVGVSFESEEAARKRAIKSCQENEPADTICTVQWVEANDGPVAAPAAMRQVMAQIERAKPSSPAPAKRVESRTASRNVLRCTNQCFNGDCIRTFENGRKERWQAPRRLNPFTSNWEWDITTNACGA